MNKFAIPAILLATVMVAGLFAFAPVEQASTVHTSGTITLESDADIDAILADTDATLPAEHAALPSTTEVSDIGAATTLTAPGSLLIAGTAGIAYVTCSGFTTVSTPDDLAVGGRVFDVLQNIDWVIAVSASDAITWTAVAGADTATCNAVLLS